MTIKQAELSWIVVSDIKKARTFFTEVLGLKETSVSEEYGWVELMGKDGGLHIGLAKASAHTPLSPGHNAVITFTVDNIEKTKAELLKKKVHLIGDIMEVPGHVKLQLFKDNDGNTFQLVEMLEKKA